MKGNGFSQKRFPLKVMIVAVCAALLLGFLAGRLFGVAKIADKGQVGPGKSVSSEKEKILYTCGMHPQVISEEPGNCPLCGMKLVPLKKGSAQAGSAAKPSGERKIAYWRAPMNPMEIYDKPGKSAMGMDLVPVYEDELSGGGAQVTIDPVVQLNMGVRTARAIKGPVRHTIRTYGHVDYDETRISSVNLRFSGWIEKLYADYTGKTTKKGAPLFDIYSPELVTAGQDLLEALRNFRRDPSAVNKKLLESARMRFTYYGVSDLDIKRMESQGSIRYTFTIRAPATGIITKKNVFVGDYVKAGTLVYEIADLSRVWVEAHIYEYELPAVKEGLPAELTLPYLPGRVFSGGLSFIYPYLQGKTRDVVVRLSFSNPDLVLKPDMYADVRIMTTPGKEGTLIPKEAVIRTGEKEIVFVSAGDGKFFPRTVETGLSTDDGMIQILSGVAPGETVVTSGQFLMDSESQLKEAINKLTNPVPKPPEPGKPEAAKTSQEDAGFFDDLK